MRWSDLLPGTVLFCGAYLFFFTPLGGLLLVFGRKRAAWIRWDYLLAVLPCFLWIILWFLFPNRKDVGNVGELIVLGISAPLLLVIRFFYGTRRGYAVLSLSSLIVCCVAAVVMFFTTDLIPEQ